MATQHNGEMFLIDKPLDWTSFDVVKRIRWTFGVKKAGHAGTLDPKATGLLIVCTGAKTKEISRFVGLEKEYRGTMELGVRTPSHDSETDVVERREIRGVTLEALQSVAREFIGKQLQTPPMYSAVKHRGKPLYKYARRGKSIEREAKEIEIVEFEVTKFEPPFAEFRVVCSKGTYIRSLVDDVGQRLGCGATLRSLRRLRIGPYHVDRALTIEQLENTRRDLTSRAESAHEGRLFT
ncbi:MAG TPA: tRNA pseudouridine(55) synthase TruB [Bacteroidota bacterium]|nr:tRNA pseudouridine(55) synthase TruB [Bacteroidota bacterium]